MERIDSRPPKSGAPNGCSAAWLLMRSKVRAYSHQGHGPRADQQAGYISATSDSTPSLANGSRSIHEGSRAADRLCKNLDIPVEACRARMPEVSSSAMTEYAFACTMISL